MIENKWFQDADFVKLQPSVKFKGKPVAFSVAAVLKDKKKENILPVKRDVIRLQCEVMKKELGSGKKM